MQGTANDDAVGLRRVYWRDLISQKNEPGAYSRKYGNVIWVVGKSRKVGSRTKLKRDALGSPATRRVFTRRTTRSAGSS